MVSLHQLTWDIHSLEGDMETLVSSLFPSLPRHEVGGSYPTMKCCVVTTQNNKANPAWIESSKTQDNVTHFFFS